MREWLNPGSGHSGAGGDQRHDHPDRVVPEPGFAQSVPAIAMPTRLLAASIWWVSMCLRFALPWARPPARGYRAIAACHPQAALRQVRSAVAIDALRFVPALTGEPSLSD
jgi:hypothetical protein